MGVGVTGIAGILVLEGMACVIEHLPAMSLHCTAFGSLQIDASDRKQTAGVDDSNFIVEPLSHIECKSIR